MLYATVLPVQLLAIVDWEMSSIGDPLVDLAWALIFHPGPEGTMRLGTAKEPRFEAERLPSKAELIERYAKASGRDVSAIGWYDVFSRWKLAIALGGQLREVPARGVQQAGPRILRPASGSAAGKR